MPCLRATDFKSVVSTCFTIRAYCRSGDPPILPERRSLLRRLAATKKPLDAKSKRLLLDFLEAGAGIEPTSTDLQSAA